MSTEHLVGRRTVLGWMVAAGAAPTLVALAGCTDDDRPAGPDREGPTRTTEAPVDPAVAAVAAVGRRYREDVPEEDDRAVLLDALGLGRGEVTGLDDLPDLAQAVTADFAAGRTVSVDGWVLALTEARAAALVSLL